MNIPLSSKTESFVIVVGGDGYGTVTVHSREAMEQAFVRAHWPDANFSKLDEEQQRTLDHVRDEDQWETNYELGRVRLLTRYEDGWVEVLRLTGNLLGPVVETSRPQFKVDLPDGDGRTAQIWFSELGADGYWHISISIEDSPPNSNESLRRIIAAYDAYRGRGVSPAPNEYQNLVAAIDGARSAVKTSRESRCACDPATFVSNMLPPICERFRPDDDGECGYCDHPEACHGGAT